MMLKWLKSQNLPVSPKSRPGFHPKSTRFGFIASAALRLEVVGAGKPEFQLHPELFSTIICCAYRN